MHNLFNVGLVAALLLLVTAFATHMDDRIHVEIEQLNERSKY
jgi:hypothetical protein